MLLVVGQAAGNLFMVSGTFPVVGIPLPFIRSGGSALRVTMPSMRILLNICHHGIQVQRGEARLEGPKIPDKPHQAPLHLVK